MDDLDLVKAELTQSLKKLNLVSENEIILQEVYDLYSNAKKRYLTTKKKKKITEAASILMLKIFFKCGAITENYLKKWQNGEVFPKKRELNLLKIGCQEVLTAFKKHFKEELVSYIAISYDEHYAKTKQRIDEIKTILSQET